MPCCELVGITMGVKQRGAGVWYFRYSYQLGECLYWFRSMYALRAIHKDRNYTDTPSTVYVDHEMNCKRKLLRKI